jgi:leader peptidase (prepilin peptidase)/N-methyltransferase
MAVLSGCCGLVLGSFVATASLRFARAEPFIGGRSHCDACGTALGAWDTAPVLSYVIKGGRCAACGSAIEPLQLAGELAGSVLLVVAFLAAPPLQASLIAALGLCLLAAAIVDAKTQILPDALTAAAAALGLVLAALTSWSTALIGLAAGAVTFAALEGVRRGYLATRGRPGLGFGDVKLAGALALWLGLATPWAIVLAALLGIGWAAGTRRGGARFAFGPALAAGGMAVGLLHAWSPWPA